ncbi:MAG: hypothetical protein ACXABJ_10930 [Candidatus Heimdallarchaeaceae archaeon]
MFKNKGEIIKEELLIERAIAVHSRKIRCKTTTKKTEIQIIEEIISKVLSNFEDERIVRKKE